MIYPTFLQPLLFPLSGSSPPEGGEGAGGNYLVRHRPDAKSNRNSDFAGIARERPACLLPLQKSERSEPDEGMPPIKEAAAPQECQPRGGFSFGGGCGNGEVRCVASSQKSGREFYETVVRETKEPKGILGMRPWVFWTLLVLILAGCVREPVAQGGGDFVAVSPACLFLCRGSVTERK